MADDKGREAYEVLMAARDAARANWRQVVNETDSEGRYDDEKARHWSGTAGWLKHRAEMLRDGKEPDWPDAATFASGGGQDG
jgi:hypothetical protein